MTKWKLLFASANVGGAMEVKKDYEYLDSYHYLSSACHSTQIGLHGRCFPVSFNKFLLTAVLQYTSPGEGDMFIYLL